MRTDRRITGVKKYFLYIEIESPSVGKYGI